MRLIWRSRQGQQRSSNNDALTVGKRGNLLFCMLVDAAEKSDGQRLARYWGTQIVKQLIERPDAHDSSSIIECLKKEQQQLRSTFLLEFASYCLLHLESRTGRVLTFHVGDCRAGEVNVENTSWWFMPHTLEQELGGGSGASRHVLTRSLNVRRNSPPVITSNRIKANTTLIMATDGYWAECLQEGCPHGKTLDDASYLIIKPGAWGMENFTDADNSFVIC